MLQQQVSSGHPRKKKEEEEASSPWWDFFSHCKEAADSSDSDSEDDSQNKDDVSFATSPTHSANDDLIISINSAPLSPASIVRTTPVKLISVARTNNNADGSENDDCESTRPDTPGTQDDSFETSSYDDDCNFIGNIEIIMPISPLLSTQQRNIRKNAYDLLKRLGEEESLFDLNSVESDAEVEREDEEEGYKQQRQQQQQQHHLEVQEEVDGLKRQLEECTDMVVHLHDNLRSYSNDAANNDVISTDKKRDYGIWDDDVIMAELHAEIATLTSQLQSAALKNTQDAQLLRALQESSHHYLDKIREYEEMIDSLNEAVARSHLYNEEILMELLVLRKENDDLTTKLLDSDKKREKEKENQKSTHDALLLS